jgi:hypothetical protein
VYYIDGHIIMWRYDNSIALQRMEAAVTRRYWLVRKMLNTRTGGWGTTSLARTECYLYLKILLQISRTWKKLLPRRSIPSSAPK